VNLTSGITPVAGGLLLMGKKWSSNSELSFGGVDRFVLWWDHPLGLAGRPARLAFPPRSPSGLSTLRIPDFQQGDLWSGSNRRW